MRQPPGKEQGRESARRGEDQALYQEMAQQTATTRPDSRSNGNLALKRDPAGKQQVGNVGAGNQQDKTYSTQHDKQRSSSRAGESGVRSIAE